MQLINVTKIRLTTAHGSPSSFRRSLPWPRPRRMHSRTRQSIDVENNNRQRTSTPRPRRVLFPNGTRYVINNYSSAVALGYRHWKYTNRANKNSRSPTSPFLKTLMRRPACFFFFFIFSITTRSHRMVSRTLPVVKTPSSTRAQKSGSSKNALYLHLHNGSC